ncbi:ParB/Srx family N-terminal domain-containing protein [Pseudoalteromonas shioyasakiensis]|uniref:ParB/Srx family N-terminal domain-containing protein n=1 Tax=Pseudoalteromonas shioyasakiensis TaxID=1190813 RepID=UPI002551CC45|nr:ParB/Srx family N-terminal domain-containing protein [Pseudoalteromonas shioyasakiensis]MDK9685516.1 ParB/Srx family N-terminal domain-containing protein [Pseudoalteromonas shioyasakiensis]
MMSEEVNENYPLSDTANNEEDNVYVEPENETTNEINWWEKRVLRSVDQLKLWQDNPRLDPAENHVTLADFAEELISIKRDKDSFFELVSSIASKGFKSFDPIVVWQNEKGKYVVAEGNRRTLALKLLRNPNKAPRSIRRFILQQSELIDRADIEKVRVCVAPSYDECEWYILQRHSTSSMQVRWERLQQQRLIVSLCDKYNNDLEVIRYKTGFTRSEIERTLRYVKIRNLATRQEVTSLMDLDEKEIIYSHRIPMSILERWFDSLDVREAWGIEYAGSSIKIMSNEASFLYAYGKFLKLIFNSEKSDAEFKINTRSIPERNKEILALLPEVSFTDNNTPSGEASNTATNNDGKQDNDNQSSNNEPEKDDSKVDEKKTIKKNLSANPDRNKLVDEFYQINVSSYKLAALFREFKQLPVARYKNTTAASLRVFLDLSVDEYIGCENLKQELAKKHSCAYGSTTLHQRLSFIANTYIKDPLANKVIGKLLQHNEHHSLDTLNNYIHGTDTHNVSKRFINGFWDMLTPLFKVLIELKAE